MLKVAGIVVVCVVCLVLVLYLIGASIPAEHSVRLERTIPNLRAAPLRALLLRVENYPQWRKDLKAVEVISPSPLRYRETSSHGQIAYEMTALGDSELQTRITDESLPFGGNWRIAISEKGNSSHVVIVENGVVKAPFYRLISKYVIGHERSIMTYLDALEAHAKSVGASRT